MTDFLAFMAGIGSAVPAIRHASLYAAFGAVFDFFYQVTFFVAGLVYKGRTQEAQREFPLCCLPVGNPACDPHSLLCLVLAHTCAASQVSDAAKDTVCISYPGKPPRKYDPGAPLPMEVVARSLAHAVLHPIGRLLVIATGIAVTAVAAWQVPMRLAVLLLHVRICAAFPNSLLCQFERYYDATHCCRLQVPKVETNFNYEWFAAQDSPIRVRCHQTSHPFLLCYCFMSHLNLNHQQYDLWKGENH